MRVGRAAGRDVVPHYTEHGSDGATLSLTGQLLPYTTRSGPKRLQTSSSAGLYAARFAGVSFFSTPETFA